MAPPARPANFALYTRFPTRVPPLAGVVDIWPTEEHMFTVATTEHPVESGRVLTDNAVRMPTTLRLTGWVADLLVAPGVTIEGDPALRAPDAWQLILRIMEEREPMTVYTALMFYESMLITSATTSVSVSTGRSLQFELGFTEILIGDTDPGKINFARVGGDGDDFDEEAWLAWQAQVDAEEAAEAARANADEAAGDFDNTMRRQGLWGGPGGPVSPAAPRTSTVHGGTRRTTTEPDFDTDFLLLGS